jgi:hypothetical protein
MGEQQSPETSFVLTSNRLAIVVRIGIVTNIFGAETA